MRNAVDRSYRDRYSLLDYVSGFSLHFFRALAASCVLYNRTEHSQGFSTCNIECAGMLRNLPECSMGLVLSMVLKPNAFFSLLYFLLRLTDFITDWFEFDLSINKLII